MRLFHPECEPAWNKDPVFGVIGIQSGPPGQWVHSGFHGGHGSQAGNAGSEDDREDPSRVFVQKKPIKAICREFRVSQKVVRKVIRSTLS
jgi:hypothetical protein